MTEEEVDAIVEDWHNGKYHKDVSLRDVFIGDHGWTDTLFERWVETGAIPK
jgi:hypothetical protein